MRFTSSCFCRASCLCQYFLFVFVCLFVCFLFVSIFKPKYLCQYFLQMPHSLRESLLCYVISTAGTLRVGAVRDTAEIRPYENPRALQGRTVFNRYLGIGRSNRKISKSKVVVFFNFASGRTLSTQSTGPQPIQLVPK